ncbi:MAG: family 43 glycosylhydrolase [Clostridium sp.]|nr:family 43 glycosylhydrolase [Clostridium sp.]
MKLKSAILSLMLALAAIPSWGWKGMEMPRLKVEGKYLTDQQGNVVNLHGFAQTYSPWFNEQMTKWNNYDVAACLSYNQGLIDDILNAGWEVNFLRLHMDPYWSNTPGQQTTGENDISAFNFDRFKTYLNSVFIPMAEYATSHGLYVVMRPPGVCPEEIAVGDAYQEYLIKVWKHVSSHAKLKNNPHIMFELANEPVRIKGTDGSVGGSTQPQFDALKQYFQEIVDAIRANGCGNILWVPGLGYQSKYAGYAENPIEGENIGYAVHIYPGWFGSTTGYNDFLQGWNADVQPVADFAPIMVTEMDWAPEHYNASWGKGYTGTAGGTGFGANFKKITDDAGNVSWLLFTGAELMAKFKNVAGTPGNYTFLNDPEACPWPIYHWYQDYKTQNYPHAEFTYQALSDKGNGTYANPLIYGDFPDPDVIRVEDTYYMISTTMHIFPGATILKSKDLVNWEYCSNPLANIEATDPYNLQNGQNRYGKGQWATSLQYHDGVFYILFNTNDEGSYLLTATDPAGAWEKKKLNDSYYDCGLLFDGDDIYVAYGINELHVAKLDEDFNRVRDEHVITYTWREGLEGSRMYKIGDYYYIYSTYGGIPGTQVCFRSKDPFGPYEEKMVLNLSPKSVHQGALVQTAAGQWYTMLMTEIWPFGRAPMLLPVYWSGDWPVIVTQGTALTQGTKPAGVASPIKALPTNDPFRSYSLGLQWGWNHNPDAGKWSLVERAGWLTLHTASVTNDLYYARNTLTQRIMTYHDKLDHSYGTIAIDISGMKEGDRAGLAAMQDPYSCIGVKMEGGKKTFYFEKASLTSKIAKIETAGPQAASDIVYLRGDASFNTGKVKFYYSLDNKTFTQLGEEFMMVYDLSVFTGNKWAIFNYATKALGGKVEVDWFSTEPDFTEDKYYDSNFKGYSAESLSLSHLRTAADRVVLLSGSSTTIDVTAVFMDGHEENVSLAASYASSNPGVVSVAGGRINALKDGNATLTISYAGPMGEAKSVKVQVESTSFPLTKEHFNPNIWMSGSFDEETHRVVLGQYGFGGWKYSSGLDLSEYKYLVAKFKKRSSPWDGLSLRAFDQPDYWAGGCYANAGDNSYCKIDLQRMKKDGTSEAMDPSHLYIIGFWCYGQDPNSSNDNAFEIDCVYATNDEDFLSTEDIKILEGEEEVDVYNLEGIMLMRGVSPSEAKSQLPTGIYIIGGEKVMIRK